ncbi:MAG: hypothetical protein AAGF90_24325, partial [Pseudomonadota bacterium]
MDVKSVEFTEDEIEIDFEDGSEEEIEDGVFERTNAMGVTVEERAATQDDFDRLAALAAAFEDELGPIEAEIDDAERDDDELEVEYAD